jgi:hypothetical protein
MKITTPEITLTLTPYELHLLKAACYLVAEVCNRGRRTCAHSRLPGFV